MFAFLTTCLDDLTSYLRVVLVIKFGNDKIAMDL